MADIREFKGIRPPVELVEQMAELPYDVCSSDEARAIAAGKDLNFYHITKPEIDLPTDVDIYDSSVYAKGAENYKSFKAKGYLKEDSAANLYFYTLVMNGRAQNGLVSCVSIDDYMNDIVKKHEFTREDKELDRIRHIDILGSQTGLVFLLFKNDGSKKELWKRALEIKPVYDFTAPDGIRHIFRLIEDSSMIEAFKSAFKNEILYIADGHHRAASAFKVGKLRREKNPSYNGTEGFNSFLSVIFPGDELMIMPYNRAVKDLNGLTEEEFVKKINENFTLEKSGKDKPSGKGEFSVYMSGTWYTMKPKFSVGNDPIKSLDVSVLQDNILDPLLGIDNPRTSKRIDFIGGIRGTAELVKLVDSGKYKVAFSMYPTSVDDLVRVSDSGNVMPPKSTWFEPKLRDGIILHDID